MTNLGEMRTSYFDEQNVLLEDNILKEPIAQFTLWFNEARGQKFIPEANAMAIATTGCEADPKIHMVLCKGYGKEGFKFFTNYDSPKAKDLDANPRISLVFYWAPLNRCVYVHGRAKRIPEKESDEYFHSRPRANQIGTFVSQQSRPVRNREELIRRNREVEKEYADVSKPIPRPNWGGYLVTPDSIEFWQGQSNRLHDRIRFRKPCPGEKVDCECLKQGEDGWVYERLSP